MRWTNKHNIDPAIAQAVMTDSYQLVGDISVTGLLRPPQMAALERKHEGDLVEDVADGLWRLLGKALHHILAAGRIDQTVQECKLTTPADGWEVSGTFDIWFPDGTLKDYKSTSVWRYIYGSVKDWQEQLNLYRLLAVKHDYAVTGLRIATILRDWVARKAREEDDYPAIPFIEMDVPIWPLDFTEKFMLDRVKLHQAAREGDYQPCTEDERWAQPSTWAVQRPKSKRAYRVFDSQIKATQFKRGLDNSSQYEVVFRPGRNARCEGYCTVMEFCEQAKQLGVGQNVPTA